MSLTSFLWIVVLCTLHLRMISTNKNNNCNLTVDLSNSGLNRLESNFLSSKFCVKKLILKNNELKELSPDLINSFKALEYLDISGNRLDIRSMFQCGVHGVLKTLIVDNQSKCSISFHA